MSDSDGNLSKRPSTLIKEVRDVLESGHLPVIVLDPRSGELLDANPAAEAFYGWSVSEIRAKSPSIWDDSDAGELRSSLRKLAAGTLRRALSVHRTASGETRRVELYCGPLHRDDRVLLYAIVHDLDAPLLGSTVEEQLRAVVEQSIVGIYMIEGERFSYVNQRMAEIFGYEAAELIGKPVVDLVAEHDRRVVSDNIRHRLSGTVRSMRYEFSGLRKDGRRIDIGVHGSLATVRGKPAIIGVIQDITERRKVDEAIQQHIGRLQRATRGAVDAFGRMVELRDPYTAGHQHRVGDLAVAIARELGQPSEVLEGLLIAGHVHDVGKIHVPAEILTKPSKLSHPEFEIIKTHAQHGGDILKNIDFPWPLAAVALQHHERMNGSGYPQGLRGDAILPEAKVMAVADVFEAMASHRPYRAGLGISSALDEIERYKGILYDADPVDACRRLFWDKRYSL